MRLLVAREVILWIGLLGTFIPVSSSLAVTWDDGVDPNGLLVGDGISWSDRFNWDTDQVPNSGDAVFLTTELVRVISGSAAASLTTDTTDLEIESSLNVFGPIDNDATIIVASDPNAGGTLNVGGGTSLGGSGEVLLQRSQELLISPAVLGTNGSGAATHAAAHTIRGEGNLNANLINEGTIIAENLDSRPAAVLEINGVIENNNIIRTTNSARIDLDNDITQSGTGRLIADDNIIRLNQMTVTGGTMESVGTGVFASGNGTIGLDGVHFQSVLTKFAETTAATISILNNTLINDGMIFVGVEETDSTTLNFSTSELIDGTGEIVMVSSVGFGSRIRSSGGAQGTMGAGQTVRGVGFIEANLVNNGKIIAQPNFGSVLDLRTNSKINNSLIQADPNSILRVRGMTISQNDPNGRFVANGGIVELTSNGVISGGRLEFTAGGRYQVNGSGRLEDIEINAPLDILSASELDLTGSSLTNNNSITVNTGVSGITTLDVDSDVLLDGTGEIVLPNNGAASRILISSGFTLTQDVDHTVRGPGQLVGSGGTFINNGLLEGDPNTGLLEVRSIRLGGNGTLKNVEIGFVATHAPGESTAIVPLEGTYAITNNSSTLEIEIGGLTPGTEHDQLDSTGTVSLDGDLEVLALDLGGYVPTPGDRFTIIQSTSPISGTFDNVSFPDILGNRVVVWDPIDYSDPNKVVLEIATVDFFDADFDEDGDVDNDDLTNWQTGYGTLGAGHTDGDADGDGLVTGADFLVWQQQFGLGVSSLVTTAVPVPEPGCFVSCLTVLSCGLLRWPRQQST